MCLFQNRDSLNADCSRGPVADAPGWLAAAVAVAVAAVVAPWSSSARLDPIAARNPSAPFIQRPVKATTLYMIAILLVGLSGYKFLPLSALPQVDYPTIQVQTFLPRGGRK